MNRSVIHSDHAPRAIGPYSQAICAGHLVFTAGQVALDPKTGELVGETIEEQTHQVFANLKAVLAAANSSLASVVKTTVFVTNLNDFVRMNAVYGEYFTSNPPARSTVEVSALPRGAMVEIECIAMVNEG